MLAPLEREEQDGRVRLGNVVLGSAVHGGAELTGDGGSQRRVPRGG